MDLSAQLGKIDSTFVENNIQNRKKLLRRLKARVVAKQTSMEKFALRVSRFVGTSEFFLLNLYTITLWIFLQTGIVPGIRAFDPFPFIFLVTAISIEAVFLTIFILISQHQQEKFENLSEQIALQFDIITEEELTKLLQLMVLIAEKHNIDVSHDKALEEMLRPIDLEKIEDALEKQLEE